MSPSSSSLLLYLGLFALSAWVASLRWLPWVRSRLWPSERPSPSPSEPLSEFLPPREIQEEAEMASPVPLLGSDGLVAQVHHDGPKRKYDGADDAATSPERLPSLNEVHDDPLWA